MRNEFRANLIPSGACVNPDALERASDDETVTTTEELFAEIDYGRAGTRELVLAQEACKTCIQFTEGYCADKQATTVAEELWRRGVGLTVTGTSAAEVIADTLPAQQERPILSWELSTIPEDPADALAVLRQGLRAEQFSTKGPTPEGVKIIGQKYLEKLETQDPLLHKQILQLDEKEVARGLKYIVTTIFQQKDFTAFSEGKPRASRTGNARYNPALWDDEFDSTVVSRYLKDVVEIKSLGFATSASKAAYFEPAYFEELITRFKRERTSWSNFEAVIDNNKIRPFEALEKYAASYDRVQQQNPDTPRAYARTAARLSVKIQDIEHNTQEMGKQIVLPPEVTPGIIRSVTAGNSDPHKALSDFADRLQAAKERYGEDHPIIRTNEILALARTHRTEEGYLRALAHYEENFVEIKQRYAGTPGLTDSYIRRFSTAPHVKAAVEAVDGYLENRTALLGQSDGTVPLSMINKCAARGMTVFADVKTEHRRKVLVARFNQRSGISVPASVIDRLVSLYPNAELDAAAENIYSLIDSRVLVHAKPESFELTSSIPDALDKIFSPKTGEYLAFSAALRELTPTQRLVIAHHYNLMPILYGHAANQLKVEQVTLGNQSLATYYERELDPHLAAIPQEDNLQPLSIAEICTDAAAFEDILSVSVNQKLPSESERLSVQGVRDVTLVIGGKVLYLHDTAYAWDWASRTPDFDNWLQSAVRTSYPTEQQARGWECIQAALSDGVLELLGTSPGEYRLVFSRAFYGQSIDELERAVVANAMGIDRLLYGSDLTATLKHRLGNTRPEVHIQRAANPEITEFSEPDLAPVRQSLALEALNIEAQAPLRQLLLTIFGDTYNFNTPTAAQWKIIADDLLEAYNTHIENPNHEHEIYDELTKAQVSLAWTYARGGDLTAMGRLFSINHEDFEAYIAEGLLYIRAQFESIPPARLRKTIRILEGRRTATQRAITDDSTAEGSRLEGHDFRQPTRWANDRIVIIPGEHNTRIYNGIRPIDIYLSAVRKLSKMPYEDEVAACKAVEAGVLAEAKLKDGTVAEDDKADYQRLVMRGKEARDDIVKANLFMVIAIAKKFPYRASLDFSDYIQEGNLGIMHALEKYDYKPGYRFSTYAAYWANQYMQRAFNGQSRTIRVSNEVSENIQRYYAYTRSYAEEHSNHPSDEEIRQHFDWSDLMLKSVKTAVQQKQVPLSAPAGTENHEGEYDEVADLLTDTFDVSPDEYLAQAETLSTISNAVQSTLLDAGMHNQALAVTLRHGLELRSDVIDEEFIAAHSITEGTRYTTEEIGAMLGKDSTTIDYHLRRARAKLQEPKARQRLDYLLGKVDSPKLQPKRATE